MGSASRSALRAGATLDEVVPRTGLPIAPVADLATLAAPTPAKLDALRRSIPGACAISTLAEAAFA
jgi:hypothetical protein